MSKTNSLENSIVAFIFNNTAMPSYGSNLYLALHTSDPGETGSYSSECAYTNYARVLVTRDVAGWTVSGNEATNAALVQFPISGSGPEVATHWSVGTAASGGTMLYSFALNSSLTINNLVQPQFAISSISVSED